MTQSSETASPASSGLWKRLTQGLKRSSDALTEGLKNIFVRRRLDRDTLAELEDLLIMSDMGVETASRLIRSLSQKKLDQDVTLEEIKQIMSDDLEQILKPVEKPLEILQGVQPHVILMVGVNGSGKTTTISKLARQFQDQGRSVMLAAGDTFRAAAVEQLQTWGQRLGVPVVSGTAGADPAGVAYEAYQKARREGTDVLLIDTAGRLQNKTHLMEELKKIRRVLGKIDPAAPHSVVLILDGTTGQNAHNQVSIFSEICGVTGLIITKLDGTAKGGVVISLASKFQLPLHAIAVGETMDDFRPFEAKAFVQNLLGTADLREYIPPATQNTGF